MATIPHEWGRMVNIGDCIEINIGNISFSVFVEQLDSKGNVVAVSIPGREGIIYVREWQIAA